WNKFAAKFNELYVEAKELKALNPKLQSQIPVKKVQELAKVGREKIKPIKVSSPYLHEIRQSYLSTFPTITEQLHVAADDFSQTEQIVLSPEETRLLKKILRLIDELRTLQKEVEEAFKATDVSFSDIFTKIDRIKTLMLKAGVSVAESEFPQTSSNRR